ncbi:hypothetical protein P9222_09085 [Paenibacillus amylolyticus]|nr:hypothetical protein [Paenibacillus amylolyticus]WFR64302.1 hypothetical protein P9222_09085 [Paenibacillus amylolyticus]
MAKATAKILKYPVLEVFRDKETKRKYPVGSEYETDDQDRAEYLKEFGYLGEPVTDDSKQPEPITPDSGKPLEEEMTVKPDDKNPDPAEPESKTNSKADKE